MEPRPWQKRYTVKQTITGKLVVMVSQYIPAHMPGDWYWDKYKNADLKDLSDVVCRLRMPV